MAIYPDEDQIRRLLTMDMEEPVAMLNLLKFKEKAEYREGDEAEPCTGAEAYLRYSAALGGWPNNNGILDRLGARILFAGPVQHGIIGTLEATDYDMIAIVRYQPVFPLKLQGRLVYANFGTDENGSNWGGE